MQGADHMHTRTYKSLPQVLWRNGTRDRVIRLVVLKPIRYRKPAYLITTDLETPDAELLQAYFDRWEIEGSHRAEKDFLGVGQAQVGAEGATWWVPQFPGAVYAMLLLASLAAFGPKRPEAYAPQSK